MPLLLVEKTKDEDMPGTTISVVPVNLLGQEEASHGKDLIMLTNDTVYN